MHTKSADIVWQLTKVTKEDRRKLNGHKSCVLWFTGLSGAGKSTLATELEKVLFDRKIRTYVLDGDNIRHGLNKNLGFSPSGGPQGKHSAHRRGGQTFCRCRIVCVDGFHLSVP